MIKVLVVEDSVVSRELIVHILDNDPGIEVIGIAKDGQEAVEFLEKKRPDIITMDIIMPRLDGFQATRTIMETDPIPIIIVSASYHPDEIEKTFQAIEAGAVSILDKPKGIKHPDHEKDAKNLIQTLKIMSGVKVIKRMHLPQPVEKAPAVLPEIPKSLKEADISIIAIGVSTGGPPVLKTILSGILSEDLQVPVVIVQHIAMGFMYGLVQWLARITGAPIQIANNNEYLIPGHVYFAPDDHHLGVNNNDRAILSDNKPEHGVRPSVSHLFRSVANAYGQHSIGVLLTGMGADGSKELKMMKDRGAVTIAQDKESSIVYGMPGEAVKNGGATYVLPPDKIVATIKRLVSKKT